MEKEDGKGEVCKEVLCGVDGEARKERGNQGSEGGTRHRGGMGRIRDKANHGRRKGRRREGEEEIEWAKSNTEGEIG